jgi:hypothetical protein
MIQTIKSVITKHFRRFHFTPFLVSPACREAPSPVGEGWDGGNLIKDSAIELIKKVSSHLVN